MKQATYAVWLRIMILAFSGMVLCSDCRGQPLLTGPTNFVSDDAFLDYIEHQTFNFFWSEVNTNNGLIRDRSTSGSACSIASIGFGISAINSGIERGWITREQGRARVKTVLQFLYGLPMGTNSSGKSGYHGWFYHMLNMNTGLRQGTSELSASDNAILMSGTIDAGIFFDDPTNADEMAIRTASSNLLSRYDWQWIMRSSDHKVYQHWTPENGFSDSAAYGGYNQVAYLYMYGVGAATNPLPADAWASWANAASWKTYYGYSYAFNHALFCYQYSHCWIDFRAITDAYMRNHNSDYFENSRRAAYVHRAYAQDNPKGYPNYSTNEWGLTACSGPSGTINGIDYAGYSSRGCPSGLDDGTLAPTGAAGMIPFAPEIAIPTTKYYYLKYMNRLWTTEGFRAAYNNYANNWEATWSIGIDQGAILLGIENYRSQSLWKRMKKSPILQRGLQLGGFTAPPPSDLVISAQSPTQWRLSWLDNSRFETGFQVESSTDGNHFITAAVVGPDITNVMLTVSPALNYFFRVRSTSGSGNSGVIEAIGSSYFPKVNLTVPQPDSSFVAPAVIDLEASVQAGSAAITNVRFYANQTNLLAQISNGPYAFHWPDVAAGTYSLSVSVVFDVTNHVDSDPIMIYVTPPGAPAAPQSLQAQIAMPTRVNLGWVISPGATGYIVLRDGAVISRQQQNSYGDANVVINKNYCYLIIATNSLGNSAPGTPECVTIPGTSLVQYSFNSPPTSPILDTNNFGSSLNASDFSVSVNGSQIVQGSNGTSIAYNTSALDYPTDPVLRIYPGSSSSNTVTITGNAVMTKATAVSASSYFTFSVNATASNVFYLQDLEFVAARGGASTPRGFAIRSSADDFAGDLIDAQIPSVRNIFTHYAIDLSGGAYQGKTNVTFRFYTYSPSVSSTIEYDNILINGSVMQMAAPIAPQITNATPVGYDKMDLTWTCVSNATGYIIIRDGTPVGETPSTTYADTGLTEDTSYCYSIIATNQFGQSPPGDLFCMTTPTSILLSYEFNGPATAPIIDTNNFESVLLPSFFASGIISAPLVQGGSTYAIGYLTDNLGYDTDPVLRILPGSSSVNSSVNNGTAVTDASTSIAVNAYFSFTLMTEAGKVANLASLEFDAARGGTSTPRGFVIKTSADGFQSNLLTSDIPDVRNNFTHFDIDLGGASFQARTNLEFRLYTYSPSINSSLEFDNFKVHGFVTADGLPTSLLFSNKIFWANKDLIYGGSGGIANGTFYLLMATNLTPPVAWFRAGTNSFDSNGAFQMTLPQNAPSRFFKIQSAY